MVNALREWLEAFTKAIKDLDDDALENKPDIQSKIAEGSRPLIESLEFYLNGKMLKAYERFENGIMHFKDSLIDLTKDSGDDPTKLSLFFRLRSSGEPRLSRRELFHIPFSQRHLVGTQRFSVTGTPCLYTAGSTYTCWEELGRPAFHELHVSALWLPSNQKLRLLDLRSTANAVRSQINNASFGKRDLTFEERQKQLNSMICKCILIWPLIGFCSIRVKQRTGSFKPEYIIPQMVMQWIAARDEIDGVAYESTHINIKTPRSIPFLSNYAFPARESKNNDVDSYITSTIAIIRHLQMDSSWRQKTERCSHLILFPNGS
jgi:hypothetical protein